MVILVADDDHGFRQTIRQLLDREIVGSLLGTEEQGSVMVEAGNGEEAVRLARELHPDLVLMDIAMPHLDGLEATRRIKAERPETKVIIVTVHDEKAYRKAAAESGADAFLLKKALIAELLPTIRENIWTSHGKEHPPGR